MEPFEPIRRSASRLHDQAVLAGADATSPLALIEHATRELDLQLAWLEKDHPALKGARALFDHQSGTVVCEAGGSAAERAQLAAHEIGHACIHATSSSCVAEDVDPSRPTETAPVGLQRVEDYGAHERRELQANVFAREFLFPRTLARQLHVDQEMTSVAIAELTGLPKTLVRQQLFDALLLPTPPEDSEATKPIQTRREDPSQERASRHRGCAFQLQAGPGTGKTSTLGKRVSSLIDEGVDPASILVLTFSNRAAGELADRLANAMPEAAPRIWIGTFHAFGLDLVRRHHDLLGLPADPSLFDRSDAIEVLEEILPTLPLVHYRNLWDPAMILREIVGAISRAKDEMTDRQRYRTLAEGMLGRAKDENARVAAEKCLEVAHIYDLYEQAMRERGAVDFGDLIMRPALLLESDSRLKAAVQLRHRHVLVDEYQDVNRASGRLLKALAGDGKRLWVVGDSRQSIYRFRGASSTNMAAFSTDYPGAIADQLSVNYRSTRQIVDAVVAIAPHMGASQGMLPLTFTSERGTGTSKPEIRRFDTLEDEAAGIAASIRQLESSGVPLKDQAVLCRSNRRLNEIAAALEARGIAVLHLGSLFERDEVRDLLALLSLAVDRFGDGLTRIGAMERYDLSLQDVYVATRSLRTGDSRALQGLQGLAGSPGLSSEGARAIGLLASDLDGLKISSSAWEFLAHYILDKSGLARQSAKAESVGQRMRGVAIWQFLNFVREQSPTGSGLPIQRTLDRVRQLVLLAEERDLRQVPTGALHMNAVRLMTVHGSKGLEFEAVHVPGLTVSSFPLNNRGQRCPPPVGMIEGAETLTASEESKLSQEHEEQCLYFVSASRARTYLRFYLARLQPNGNNRKPSPFLAWLPSNLVMEPSSPAKLPLAGTSGDAADQVVLREAISGISDSQFGLYDKCPRRFFYTHVLGLGNAKKPTAFTRTHDCIHKLMAWLGEERTSAEPTVADVESAFEKIWTERGPTTHAFADDYRKLASQLIASLVKSGANRRFRNSEPLAIDFPNGRVIVKPHEFAELPNGTVMLRKVNTGKKRTDEYDRLDYTLYQLAGQSHFGVGFVLEALHLTDHTVETVTITAQKLQNRKATSDAMLKSISNGFFPTETDAVTCPRCPHFFVCNAIPKGPLTRA